MSAGARVPSNRAAAAVLAACFVLSSLAAAAAPQSGLQGCTLTDVSPGPGSTPSGGSSLWGKMLSLSMTGLERAAGPPTAWSSINAGVTIDHMAAADDQGQLMLFYSYAGSDWKTVNITEKTNRTIAVVRPESWVFPESATANLERIAAPSPSGDLLLFSWQAGSDWKAETLTTSAATRITGPVTAWATTLGASAVEHIAARSTTNRLLVFWRIAGGTWAVVDVTAIAGQQVGGPPTSWAYKTLSGDWTERLAAPAPNGDLLLLTFTPSTDWTAQNLTTSTRQQVGGALIDWRAPSGTIEYLAAPAPNGDLVVFSTESIEGGWSVLNLTSKTGQRVNGPVTYWVVAAGTGWWEHLGARGPDDHVYVFHKPTGGTWAVVDVTNATGTSITASPCSWTTAGGGGTVENVAAPGLDGHLYAFSFAGSAGWSDKDVSITAQGRTIYAGTERAGVWKSVDYGMNWAQLVRPQPAQGASASGALDVPMVLDVAVSWKDPRIVVAGTAADGRTSSRTGIYRSADAGATWTLVHKMTCNGTAQPVTQVIFAPDAANTLYAAGGCAIAVSNDGGVRWDDVTLPDASHGARAWHVAVSPLQPGDKRRAVACGDGRVWYSHDSGANWSKDAGANTQLPSSVCGQTTIGNGDAAQVLAIEPGAPARVYLANQDYANGPAYFHPDDGGEDGVRCNNPVLYDADGSGTVNAKDTSLWGLTPRTGATLKDDPRLKYVDTNGNGHWDTGEPVVWDLDADGVYDTIPTMDNKEEPVLYGKAPTVGTALKDDPKIEYEDRGAAFGRRPAGSGSLWYGDLSSFDPAAPTELTGTWTQLPGPPVFWGNNQTASGAAYVRTHTTPSGFLVFFADGNTLHVSDGKPVEGGWHRLDGWDPSRNKQENKLHDFIFVHADPHGLAISSDFDLTLRAPGRLAPSPYNQNRELDTCKGGRLWMSNDGGVYRSDDCGQTWSETQDGLHTLAVINIGGVARSGTAPALYFGTGDNDDFHSLDAGGSYRSSVDGCGDCGAWFADSAAPGRVLGTSRTIKGAFAVYESASGYPDPASGQTVVAAPTHASATSTTTIQLPGWRPIIQTLKSESVLGNGDYVIIQEFTLAGQAAARRLMRAKNPSSWKTPWTVEASLPSNDVTVVQAAGGHALPTYYAGNGSSLWRSARDSAGAISWTQIVPGGGATTARKFFVNPYDATDIYIVDVDAVRRWSSSGAKWIKDTALDTAVTDAGAYSYACGTGYLDYDNCVLTDMIFDRQAPSTRFAAGLAGVFASTDGTTWNRLVDTRALPSRPAGLYYNAMSDPSQPELYIAFLGRGLTRCRGGVTSTSASQPAPDTGRAGAATSLPLGDFEAGTFDGWDGSGAVELTRERVHAGRGAVRLGGRGDQMAELSQSIAVPAGVVSPTLAFWSYIETTDAQPGADALRVIARAESGAATLAVLTNADALGRWGESRVSLAAYRGQRVTITFRSDENAKDATLFYLDGIRLIGAEPKR